MNILVIGSKGFIGSQCVRHFAVAHTVYGCDVAEDPGRNYFQYKGPSTFSEVFSAVKFDLCINASGSPGVAFSFLDKDKDRELNVTNVEHLLRALVKHQPGCRFVNMSSAAVYGNPAVLPVSETAPPAPLSPYGMHKLEAEELLLDYHRLHGAATCSLRIFSAYGPGLRKQLFWDIFTKAANTGGHIQLYGTGKESRDFIFIDDLMLALEAVARGGPFRGESVNVASGVETTIAEAAAIFLGYVDPAITFSFSGEIKSGDPLNWRADIGNLKSLGFKGGVSIREGLERTVRGYKLFSA